MGQCGGVAINDHQNAGPRGGRRRDLAATHLLGQPVREVQRTIGLHPLVNHDLLRVVVQRGLEDAHHRQGFLGPLLLEHQGRHAAHGKLPQTIPQLHHRHQGRQDERPHAQLLHQEPAPSGTGGSPPEQQRRQPAQAEAEGSPLNGATGQQRRGEGGHLRFIDQGNPELSGRQAGGQHGNQGQGRSPQGRGPPARSQLLRGQGNQKASGGRRGDPVARKFGGRRREEDKDRQQPTGRKALEGLLGRHRPGTQGSDQARQQQRGEGQRCHHQDRQEKPPGLQVVVHHTGEALKVVVAKKAVPVGLAFHQQLQGVPRQRHRRGQGQAAPGSPEGPKTREIPLQQGKQQGRQAG